MTGYGKSEVQSNEVSLSLELRTINSRFLDFSHRLPKILSSFEDDALKLIKSKCIRGRVTLSVKLDYLESEKNCFVLNQNKLENYMRMVKEIQEKAFVKDSPSIGEILSFPDILNFENENEEIQLKTIFLDALKNALVENDDSRILEGKNIQDDLVGRIGEMMEIINQISLVFENYRDENIKKYRKKILDLIKEINLDENRIYQEIAIMAEKKDITEEIVRFKSHIDLFNKFMDSNGNDGKKLNFILQEMGREINTIGSKTDLINISHLVVQLKDEIEKIREQVQNII